MSYTFQSFSSGSFLTKGQAQQIEQNVRDHTHGFSGVLAGGCSFNVSSKGAAFSVTKADQGTLFRIYGTTAVTLDTAGALGANFGAGFVNVGSGRVIINAAAGQYLQGSSYYALTLGEGIVIDSDGIALGVRGGGWDKALLSTIYITSSIGPTFDLTQLWPTDFLEYELSSRWRGAAVDNGILIFQISVDSGSTFYSAGYANTAVYTAGVVYGRLGFSGTNLEGAFLERVTWTPAVQSAGIFFNTNFSYSQPAAAYIVNSNVGYKITSVSVVNALRFSTEFAAGATSGTLYHLYGTGRPRSVI